MFDLSSAEWTAIGLSLRIAMVATACALPFGIAIGWLLARGTFWGKTGLAGLDRLPPAHLVRPQGPARCVSLRSFRYPLCLPLDRRGASVGNHGLPALGAADPTRARKHRSSS